VYLESDRAASHALDELTVIGRAVSRIELQEVETGSQDRGVVELCEVRSSRVGAVDAECIVQVRAGTDADIAGDSRVHIRSRDGPVAIGA
jgi:hypothetical protein